MDELKETYQEWLNFVEIRELAREKAQNPDGAQELREQIDEAKAKVLRAKAELQQLQAKLVLMNNGEIRYSKASFDHKWTRHKAALKRDLEKLIAQQIEAGVSIPVLMKALGSKNASMFYTVKENLNLYRDAAKDEVREVDWQWSDATSVHRFALGTEPGSSKWAAVLMKGARDTEFEGTECVYAFDTGYFITGNRALYDATTPSVKKSRSHLLADIISGTYDKKVIRDHNPYFAT